VSILSSLVAADPLFPTRVIPNETPLDIFGNYALVVGAVLIVLFTVLYGVGFRWWRNRAGRAVLGVFCSVSLLLVHLTVLRFMGGDYPNRDVIRAIAYCSLPITVGYMVYGLILNFFRGPTPINIEKNDRFPTRRKR
jgi:hypothetical protein